MAFRNSAPKRVIDPEVPDWAEEDSSGDLLAQKYLSSESHGKHFVVKESFEKKRAPSLRAQAFVATAESVAFMSLEDMDALLPESLVRKILHEWQTDECAEKLNAWREQQRRRAQ